MRAVMAWATGVVVAGMSAAASGQAPDLLELGGEYLPGVEIPDIRPAEAQLASYDAVINVPIPLSDAVFLIPGVSYHAESVSFAHAPPELVQLRAFHALDVSLLSVQLLPNQWALSWRFSAGLAGDFRGIDRDLVRMNAMALATHGFSDRFVLGGGALASYAFGSLLPLPALYVAYAPLDNFRVEAFLPAFIDLRWTFFDRLELGYEARVRGNSYAIRDDRIAGEWPCASDDAPGRAAARELCFDHVAYSTVTLGPVAAIRLWSTVWLNLGAGHTVFRRFEQLNPDDEPIPGGVGDLPNTFYVRSGLTWRIPDGAE